MVVTSRYVVLIMLGLVLHKGENPLKKFPWEKKQAAIGRFAIGQAGFALQSIAVILIPVGLLSVISRTSPFWLAILSHFFIGELVTRLEIIGMIVCFSALVLITFSDTQTEDSHSESSGSNVTRFIGILLIFANAWATAGTFVINRALKGIN